MDKYEYKLKTEQMLELMENGAYNRAAEIADTIDWKRVRNATMLTNVSDIYEKNGDYQKSYEVLNIAYHRAEGSRKVLYRLCTLAIKTGNVDEAIDYYDDFMQVAPKDPNQHILKYKILRARRTPIEQQIEALEEFKKAEYIEEWAYELAKLYQEAGMTAECLEECDDLILWFSEGKYVYKAMELKMQYKPLTPSQQEKYDHRYEKIESETEEIPDLTEYLANKNAQETPGWDSEEEDEPVWDKSEADEEASEVIEMQAAAEEAGSADDVFKEEVFIEEASEEEALEDGEPVGEEPIEIDETVQRLTQKGIASTMKLQDALKSLLRPEPPVEEALPDEEDMEEDAPELEAAIEEIESVVDLELVNEYAGRTESKKIKVDKDLEELKAEPLEETTEAFTEPDEEAEEPEAELDAGAEAYEEETYEEETYEEEPYEEVEGDEGLLEEEVGYEEEMYEEAEEYDSELEEEDEYEEEPEEYNDEVYEEELDEETEEYDAELLSGEDVEDILEDFIEDFGDEPEENSGSESLEEEDILGDIVSEDAVPYEEDSDELPVAVAEELFAADAGEEVEEVEEAEEEVEEAGEALSGDSDDIEDVSEVEGIEEAETTENKKLENKKPIDDQIDGQLSIEDILTGWGDQLAKEVEMEEKKKKAEPILPPDIQRLIDEIEGVLPEEPEPEPERPSEEAKYEPRENMGEITKQLRIDEIEDFLAAQDDERSAFEDDLPEDFDGAVSDSSEEYTDEYEDEYEDEEYADEYEDEYEDEEYADEYEDEYEDEEYADEYEDEYEDEEYTDEYEDEYEDEEYADEYEDEYEDEEYADEYEDEYEDEEYADEYEDEYEDEEYADEYEDEYEDEEYTDEYAGGDEEELYADEYDEADPDDIAAGLEEEFRPNPEHVNGPDDREIPDEDDDGMDILSATTPLSRKETAKMIATGKTAPLPLDEISNALSMSDTGFVVHGRYDLAAQSGIGTRAGLTEEQKKLFSYFVPVRGMSEQLVDVLENDRNCTNREGTSRTGNLLIIGNKGNGKTVLAVDVVKAIQKQRNIRQGKVAIVTGDSLNKKRIGDIFDKLYGGALIIEKAGKMNEKTVARLNKAMERDTGEMLIVLEEQRKPLDRLLSSNREFRRKFTCRLEVPIFINDELVTFGQTYAQENGYRIDEMGILALYSRIDNLQREDHAVTVAEVKEVMDEAMEHSQKASAKKLVKRVFGKNTDDADRIILSEKDFNI